MDRPLILEWRTEAQALAGANVLKIFLFDRRGQQGYSQSATGIIGKNALTGENMPDAQETTEYAIPILSPDNTWYFESPTNKAGLEDWRSVVPTSPSFPDDKEKPLAWG